MLIGFAAEHGDGAVERARNKLQRKRADLIVMNDISRGDIGFDSDHNEIVLVTSKGESTVSRRSKEACASAIWDAVGNQSATAAVEQHTTV
jgi:phosphopantothenoylcysteine decarboxylase/phosphopantothenate--cysteine ligase